jgi:muramidase (phage lysozyme)
MARISAERAGGANVLAFLDMIAWSEGTSTSKYTRDDGYDVIVAGLDLTPDDNNDDAPDIFRDYSKHPGWLITVNRRGLRSTAAGRYQLLHRYWLAYSKLLGLPDFSPVSQDLIAIQQIRERKALADIQAGRLAVAVTRCSNIWASFPGAGYGQREHGMPALAAQFIAAGGVLA